MRSATRLLTSILVFVLCCAPISAAQVPEVELDAPADAARTSARSMRASDAAVRAMSGLGMYVWRWERTGSPEEVVRRAAEGGMSHIVVRASSTASGFYLADTLSQLLPKAHAAGLKVVAYDPPRFEDVEADVRRAYELISFRSGGHAIDAFAADIEPRWDRLTPEATELYGARLRELAGPEFPLVAIVFPPNLVGNRFPYAEAARHFDLLAPMSYWRARTTDGAAFVAESVRQLAVYGKPVSVSGQAFSYDGLSNPALRGHPTRPELDGAISAARAAGAVGMTFWVWEHAEPSVFEAIAAAGWGGQAIRPGLGVRPPAVRPYTKPGAAAAQPEPVVPDPVAASGGRLALAEPSRTGNAAGGPIGVLARWMFLLTAVAALGLWSRAQPDGRRRLIWAVVSAAERGASPWLDARCRGTGQGD